MKPNEQALYDHQLEVFQRQLAMAAALALITVPLEMRERMLADLQERTSLYSPFVADMILGFLKAME